MRNRIMLIESDTERNASVSQKLSEGNFFVISTSSAEKALDRVWRSNPDLILVSTGLTGMTTSQFCAYVRGDARLKNIPLMLISEGSNVQDVVGYYRMGIDDHVQYDTHPKEFMARVRALIRRSYADEDTRQVFDYPGLSLLMEERQVVVNGKPLKLTKKEFELLKTLMSRPNKVITVLQLLNAVWGYDKDVSTNTLQVHVNRLRGKLGDKATAIQNFSGVGYSFSTANLL